MANIDNLADRVVLWAGPEDDDSSYTLKVMRSLGSKVIVDWFLQEMKPTVADDCDADLGDITKPLLYGRKRQLAVPPSAGPFVVWKALGSARDQLSTC